MLNQKNRLKIATAFIDDYLENFLKEEMALKEIREFDGHRLKKSEIQDFTESISEDVIIRGVDTKDVAAFLIERLRKVARKIRKDSDRQ